MRHINFTESEYYKVAVLIKTAAFNKDSIVSHYVEPLINSGSLLEDFIAFNLKYEDKGKVSAAFMKEYIAELLTVLVQLKIEYLYVADANYFKTLTGNTKAEQHLGYVLPCKIKGYEHLSVVLGVNYQALIFNPDLQDKLNLSLTTLSSALAGTNVVLGSTIIHSAAYPSTLADIAAALQSLHQYPALTADIEAFSLRFNEAGIGTIAFAWDQHNGIAFACDYQVARRQDDPLHGFQETNVEVRALLLKFFTEYQGELTWHNCCYDCKVIIYNLWMKDLLDTEGLLCGLDIMTGRMHDTKIIAYLATNSTAGNVLGLKPLAHEFAGNWGKEDIKDIRKIALPELLTYNIADCLSTWYVRNKFYPVMVQDQQEELYYSLMLPSLKVIIQMELTGMPMNREKILDIERKLVGIESGFMAQVRKSSTIDQFELWKTEMEWQKDFEDRKAKAKNPDKIAPKDRATYPRFVFNPGSGPQLQVLLFQMLGLPVIDFTDTKQPSTGEKTLAKLLDHPVGIANKKLLEGLIGLSQVSTVLSTFVPAFKRAIAKDSSGIVWLHGSFNLGGTVSGRLSSSDPNLQNIPAKSIFAKLIKEAFMAPGGWLFCGADFNSLEDMISALTTRDKNKMKVYESGFDGHALRAVSYYPNELGHIDANDPVAVNALKKLDHPLRQESKTPTFALTYGGTYHTLMTNLGWSMEKAKAVEANYHLLYKESDDYVQTKIHEASQRGYVEVAFGLRVRTPLLKQVVFGSKSMPYEAAGEGRTAGNALGQSYGLLNNRAANAFMQKVWASKHRLSIKPVALIHDAIYIVVKDDIEVVEWANRELILAMQWQELPELDHPVVKLGAALDIFWPSWAHATTLPNGADQATILAVCAATKQELLNKEKP